MKTLLKPNLERTDLLFASPFHHQKHTARRVSVISPILKHVNTGTLAFVLFLALALPNTARGKEPDTRESAPVGTTKSEVIIDKQHDNIPNVVTEAAGQTMSPSLTLWQFMGRIINAFEAAFNNPSLIEYANQQGIGIADSPPAPLPDASRQPLTPPKSPLSQPNRFSSNY